MLAIGLLASWLGTLMWNRASQLLPAALTGQLIVFETSRRSAMPSCFAAPCQTRRRRWVSPPVRRGCCSG